MINRITLLLFIGLTFWSCEEEQEDDALELVYSSINDGEVVESPSGIILKFSKEISDEILKKGVYNVLERGLMDDVLKEQGFQQSGCVTSECAVEVGNMLGVQQMVGGSIGKVGNMYTVSARIIDVGTGEVLKSANYDLIGGIEELLMNGMNQVASELSGIRLNNRNTFSDKPITKDP